MPIDPKFLPSDFELVGTPAGSSIRSVRRVSDTVVEAVINFTGQDFDVNQNVALRAKASGTSEDVDLTSGPVLLRAVQEGDPTPPLSTMSYRYILAQGGATFTFPIGFVGLNVVRLTGSDTAAISSSGFNLIVTAGSSGVVNSQWLVSNRTSVPVRGTNYSYIIARFERKTVSYTLGYTASSFRKISGLTSNVGSLTGARRYLSIRDVATTIHSTWLVVDGVLR